ncbi:MAG: DUF2071 domain-containing protein [Planctomycetes bacterium]|nr:DUF2071 domain-containing protein [Planctomycetota bacterium]
MHEPVDRRATPLPSSAHALNMTWSELLFLHWRVPAAALRDAIPRALDIDEHDGSAWLGVVPFRMSEVRLRGCPKWPGTAEFPELNVRTYVRHGEQRGVWFFSLDAASWLSVRGARAWFGLPYFDARMSIERAGEQVRYRSERTHRRAPAARFAARYSPSGPVQASRPGSLERFLTSRYALFAQRRGALLCGEIDHAPWPLQPAEVELERCEMTRLLDLELAGEPHALYAERLEVRAWAPGRLARSDSADAPL